MSVKNAPTARSLHTAIWTGRELIIWGGWNDNMENLNTGARYDPLADTWRPVKTAGAPKPRSVHAAVWTGKEMLVWGGSGFGEELNDGGRYDPATDTWKPMSLVGAPHARTWFTAVWTGQEMIVWGGSYIVCSDWLNCESRYPADLGRYNPCTDTWKTATISAAPTPRADCTALWDGKEMLVWGGHNGSRGENLLNSGGRFDPVLGRWTAMSTKHAPAPRYEHVSLWTGREMLIWGGNHYGNTGGRYRPGTDTWLVAATNRAPAAAYGGDAVWTGEGMLVFNEKLFGYYQPGLYAWDGLPDGWQQLYFGPNNPLAFPLADSDGDGQNNWMEYLAGTNPTDQFSKLDFAIQLVSNRVNCFRLAFTPCSEGRLYTLLATTNLTHSRFLPAVNLFTNSPAQTGSFVVTNPVPQTRFFRLEVRLP